VTTLLVILAAWILASGPVALALGRILRARNRQIPVVTP
jgi:hypothetical protein